MVKIEIEKLGGILEMLRSRTINQVEGYLFRHTNLAPAEREKTLTDIRQYHRNNPRCTAEELSKHLYGE